MCQSAIPAHALNSVLHQSQGSEHSVPSVSEVELYDSDSCSILLGRTAPVLDLQTICVCKGAAGQSCNRWHRD